MNEFAKSLALRLLSRGEYSALRRLVKEFAISHYHRIGLRQIKRASLSRPAKINLGCGTFRKEGFLNVDMLPGGDVTVDLRRNLPFDSSSCDFIFSEHCMEHVDYPEPVNSLFRECFRILKPGGVFRFSVPDTEWALNDYTKGLGAEYFAACAVHRWHPSCCTTRVEHINFHFRQDGEHLFAYDEETARKALEGVGFKDVRRVGFDPSLDSKHREFGSLFIVARKPA
jgi:predicted SAM-dependent methyltransferase